MSEVMTRLHQEHRNIARILRALEHQLALFDEGRQPDYDLLEAIADYFVDFPERCHHPKEDLIYRKMREKDPAGASGKTDLESEHEKISALAEHFRQAVQNVLREVEVPRAAFSEVSRLFVEKQHRHMQMEEEYFFPAALSLLTAEDWAEIDERISREDDPLFGAKVAENFEALRRSILQWEEEDEKSEKHP